jgi:hypothetical protein
MRLVRLTSQASKGVEMNPPLERPWASISMDHLVLRPASRDHVAIFNMRNHCSRLGHYCLSFAIQWYPSLWQGPNHSFRQRSYFYLRGYPEGH